LHYPGDFADPMMISDQIEAKNPTMYLLKTFVKEKIFHLLMNVAHVRVDHTNCQKQKIKHKERMQDYNYIFNITDVNIFNITDYFYVFTKYALGKEKIRYTLVYTPQFDTIVFVSLLTFLLPIPKNTSSGNVLHFLLK
jgi:hypothetical protein